MMTIIMVGYSVYLPTYLLHILHDDLKNATQLFGKAILNMYYYYVGINYVHYIIFVKLK